MTWLLIDVVSLTVNSALLGSFAERGNWTWAAVTAVGAVFSGLAIVARMFRAA